MGSQNLACRSKLTYKISNFAPENSYKEDKAVKQYMFSSIISEKKYYLTNEVLNQLPSQDNISLNWSKPLAYQVTIYSPRYTPSFPLSSNPKLFN